MHDVWQRKWKDLTRRYESHFLWTHHIKWKSSRKKISSEFQNELDQSFEEAKGSGDLLKQIWQHDLDERKAFWKDQNHNGRHLKFNLDRSFK